jgi:hypothetical protein
VRSSGGRTWTNPELGRANLLGRPALARTAVRLDLDALSGEPPADQPPELHVFTKPLSRSA